MSLSPLGTPSYSSNSNQWNSEVVHNNPSTTTISLSNESVKSKGPQFFSNTSIPIGSTNITTERTPEKSRTSNYPNSEGTMITSNSNGQRLLEVENASQVRQYLTYYQFYCIEMLTNFSYVHTVTKNDIFGKMIFSLASLIKSKSALQVSLVSSQSKYFDVYAG